MIFGAVALARPFPGPCGALEGHPEAAADTRRCPVDEAVKRKIQAPRRYDKPIYPKNLYLNRAPP